MLSHLNRTLLREVFLFVQASATGAAGPTAPRYSAHGEGDITLLFASDRVSRELRATSCVSCDIVYRTHLLVAPRTVSPYNYKSLPPTFLSEK